MAENHPSDGPTVLVADDDPFHRELVIHRLRANLYCVVEAASGDEALPLLQRGGIDVLLTDISMPGSLDGWSLARQARQIDGRIAVVYLSSGRPEPSRQVTGSLYLRKPGNPVAIIGAIRQLTTQHDGAPPEG